MLAYFSLHTLLCIIGLYYLKKKFYCSDAVG